MNLRPRLTYANVVATLALALALGGGTVYAALHLGKNAVKSRNIAAGAVKKSDLGKKAVRSKNIAAGAVKEAGLGKNAVTSPKVEDGTITVDDIAAEAIAKIDADVGGAAKAGPQGGINTPTPAPLPLTGKTTFTPKAGEVSAIAAEGQFTIATTSALEFCQPAVFLLVNGEPTRVFVTPEDDGDSTSPVQSIGRDADGPFGLIDPDTPLTISAQLRGDDDCTASSRLDRLEVRIVQIR